MTTSKPETTLLARVPRSDLVLAAVAAGALGFAATLANAEMSDLDTDGDGSVSYTELLLAVPELTETDFAALDVDQSGSLDAAEYDAATGAGLIPAE